MKWLMMYCSMLIIVVPYFCVYCGIYIMKGDDTVKSRSHMPDSNVCYVTASDSLDEVESECLYMRSYGYVKLVNMFEKGKMVGGSLNVCKKALFALSHAHAMVGSNPKLTSSFE